jgi:hypothetical protein
MQIRYLETLKTMANESGAKVIFMPPSFSVTGGSPAALAPSGGKSGVERAAMLDVLSNF